MTWKNVRLGDIAETTSGGTPNRSNESFWNGHIPWLKSGELNDGVVVSAEEFITEDGLKNSSTKLFKRGTLLLAMYGATAGKLGILDFDSTTNQALCGIMPIKESFDNKFLFNFLLFKRNQIIKDSIGGAQPNISQSYIRNMQVPLPPLPIQKRIAAILDKADELRKKDKQLLAKYDALLQSVFYDMFGDPVLNEKGWEIVSLEKIIKDGPQNGLYKGAEDYGQGVPILRIDSFYHGVVYNIEKLKRVNVTEKELKMFQIYEGNIVINRVNSRSHLGKCALIPRLEEPTLFESNMMRFSVNNQEVNCIFLVHMLIQPFMKHQILGRAKDSINQSSINQTDVKSFTLPLPPISYQNKFAAIAQNIQQQKQQVKQQMEQSEKLFQGLLQKAFSGELVKE